jgi:hypothetical protein
MQKPVNRGDAGMAIKTSTESGKKPRAPGTPKLKVAICLLLLTVVGVILSLTIPVAVQEKKEESTWTGKPSDGTPLSREGLLAIIQKHRKWLDSAGQEGTRANLSGANLSMANLNEADLRWAILREVILSHADLGKANLYQADLTGADLGGANLGGANLAWADLAEVNFEPRAGAPADLVTIVTAKHLASMKYHYFPHAMAELRDAFKKAGFRKQEREVTYAIKRSERRVLWDEKNVAGEEWYYKTFAERFFGRAESIFNLLLFELPSDYGMSPGQPLLIMIGLVFVFSIPYAIVLDFDTLIWPTLILRNGPPQKEMRVS